MQIALHDLRCDKKKVKPLSNPRAHDHEFTCQDELPQDERTKVQIEHDASSVLAQDVLHSMQPVKEATSKMQVLALGPWKRLKSIGRYLVGRPRCVQRFPLQPEVQSLTVKVDSDSAGGKETRLSTS